MVFLRCSSFHSDKALSPISAEIMSSSILPVASSPAVKLISSNFSPKTLMFALHITPAKAFASSTRSALISLKSE
jgi:hypothetical protein